MTEYHGPVLYLVHVTGWEKAIWEGEPPKSSQRQQIQAMKKRIREALHKAALFSVPVLVERGWFFSPRELSVMISSVKRKPRIITLDQHLPLSEQLKSAFAENEIKPEKITLLGGFRELCVLSSAQQLRRAFPATPIFVINGSSTISESPFSIRNRSKAWRLKDREEMKRDNIQENKKVTIRHFVSGVRYAKKRL